MSERRQGPDYRRPVLMFRGPRDRSGSIGSALQLYPLRLT